MDTPTGTWIWTRTILSQELLDRFAVTPSEIPVVICSGRSVLRNPSNQELADCLGFNTTIDESQVRDLIITCSCPIHVSRH